MSLSTILSHCIAQWKEEGLELGSPISEDEVRRVWAELNQETSADVVELYTTIGGFHEYTFDDDLFWSLWPWQYLQERNKELHREGIVFCDHSIEIDCWEIRYETRQHSSVWSSHGYKTWSSLEEFFKQYLEDPWQLL
ncbi:hypothetical protein OAH05_02540 [bacterium]|jgi:hypothetical protein|nr:hypothetical protein [Planctomicrobium sp.]MDA7503788.1 hypothetical protein [bacterium]MDB4731732.1 hypothetical protein [bacterium]MDB4802787.1 hypothetical protein [bacterium]